jgi:pectate lyase
VTGTTGGAAGSTVSVSTLEELKSAVTADGAAIIIITASITGAEQIKVTSDKTIVAASSDVVLTGVGLLVKSASNVILRNLTIKKVLAENGDALAVNKGTNVWIDHVDVSSDQDHDKDYYDGLIDLTHAADYITVSNSYIHDHWKASLVGHSDKNSAEDTGHLRVSYANNYFYNLHSRGPSFRFGTGHIWNKYASLSPQFALVF